MRPKTGCALNGNPIRPSLDGYVRLAFVGEYNKEVTRSVSKSTGPICMNVARTINLIEKEGLRTQ